MLQSRRIVLLFGKICSGKSTYADSLCYVTKAKRITVSDIVKKVSGISTRSELQNTAHLDQQICLELCDQIDKHGNVVIDGIRQWTIVTGIIAQYGASNIDLIWLEVPDTIRKNRFIFRRNNKDDLSFEEADKLDEKLGLLEVQLKLKEIFYSITINNYTQKDEDRTFKES